MKDELTRLGTVLSGAIIAAVLSACEAAAPVPPSTPDADGRSPQPSLVRVAFVQDLAPEPALDRTLPAQQAVELAFALAAADNGAATTVEVVPFDVEGDPERPPEIGAEIAGDPAFVAAIAAPDLTDQQTLADALRGVPLLSLSSRGTVRRENGAWLRFVAPVSDQAIELARSAESIRRSRRGVCIAPERGDDPLARGARRALGPDVRATHASDATEVASARCGVVMWSGDGGGAGRLALGLNADVRLVGGPGLRDPDFIEVAGGAAEGAMSICSCADVSTSLELEARRFVQSYQSDFGSPPGPFSLEAWDAAHVLLEGLEAAGTSRAGLASWIAGVSRHEGLANSYGWAGGELIGTRAFIREYRVVGGRWVLVEPQTRA